MRPSVLLETLTPMVGLAAYAGRRGSVDAARAAERASEVFLRRRLFRRVRDGAVIDPEFVRLHYPLYYHYDILGGLKAIARVGRARDRRCVEALDLLEEKQLPGGGWPAERRYYGSVRRAWKANAEHVDWGGTSPTRPNPWVTVDALSVLVAAGRVTI